MATNLVEKQVENTTEIGTGAARGQGWRRGKGGIGAIAALLTVLLIGSAVIHDRDARHPFVASEQRACTASEVFSQCDQSALLPASGGAVSTAQYYDDLMSQQEDFIHTMAARADARSTLQGGACDVTTAPCIMP